MNGNILSIDPMNLNSGPGIRVEIYLSEDAELTMTPIETVNRIRKFRPYFGPDGGGVTFKGKDIFKYADYLKETCLICHKAGINTCIETDGLDYNNDLELLNYTLMNHLNEKNINIWIKQAIQKDINDSCKYFEILKKYLNRYDNIKDIEIIGNDISNDKLNSFQRILKEV